MNIIKSDIISDSYDAFWADISPIVQDFTVRSVLILTTPYDKGSAEETQLLKMIEACKITADQYNIIQIKEGQQTAWHQLREKLNPKVIFLVGISPAQLGISSLFCLNEPNNFNDRIWLPTLSIGELEQYKEVKKQLWVSGITPVFINQKFGAL